MDNIKTFKEFTDHLFNEASGWDIRNHESYKKFVKSSDNGKLSDKNGGFLAKYHSKGNGVIEIVKVVKKGSKWNIAKGFYEYEPDPEDSEYMLSPSPYFAWETLGSTRGLKGEDLVKEANIWVNSFAKGLGEFSTK